MFRFRDIYEIDELNRTITVGAGTVNLRVSHAVKHLGMQFVPDPSSQKACSIGGNIGENAGGPHTLKYGVTVNHVVGLEAVMADGTMYIWNCHESVCRLTPLPESIITLLATFSTIDDACRTVSDIIAAGIVPAAMEMLDNPVIRALQKTGNPGFPEDAEALLIIELEDLTEALPEEKEHILKILQKNTATQVKYAASQEERDIIWSCPQRSVRSNRRSYTGFLYAGRRGAACKAAGDFPYNAWAVG
ncbi:hypothetical protein CHS0354_001957 [Potamilus streckersoni]|uniref:FAD-binding PCMH-type domain-containing protein n=1 Tax=Potamilus streckersoni TaxID=2493646 RepID=A0AAE0T6F3_9BIVA|nr:hypothetical protein CHS0354_001957 [Potamilus streckersoni]